VFGHARRVNKSAVNIEAQRDLHIIQRLFLNASAPVCLDFSLCFHFASAARVPTGL
jgi:hypothetical protein